MSLVSTLFARADEGLGGEERSPALSTGTYMLDHPKLAPWARDEDRRLVADVHGWLDDSLVQQWRDDAASLYRPETWRKLAEIGVLGLGVDAAFGGRGHNPLSVAVLSDAFDGRVELGTMLALYVQCIVGAGWLKLCQTNLVVALLLPEIVAGNVILGTAYTDADHAAPTTITVEGDTFVLNGHKKFVVNASFAHYFLATATADGGSMTCLVDASWPGLTIVEQSGRLGARGCVQAEVIFHDVRVPASNLLARPGFQRVMQWNHVMTYSRLCNAITAGYMLRELERVMLARNDSKLAAGGVNILSWGRNAQWLADNRAAIELIEEGFADILARLVNGENQVSRAAAFKAFAIEQGRQLALRAMELQGGDCVFGTNRVTEIFQDFICQSFSSGGVGILDIFDQSCRTSALLDKNNNRNADAPV